MPAVRASASAATAAIPTEPTTVLHRAWISRISPKLLTDFRLGYYRYNVIDTKYDQGVEFANTIGIPGINTGGIVRAFTSGAPGWQINAARPATTALIGGGLEHQPLQLPADREGETSSRSSITGP